MAPDPTSSRSGQPSSGHSSSLPDRESGAGSALARWAKVIAGLARSEVTVEEALEWTLRLVGAQTGWPLGHVLLRDTETGTMVSSSIWSDSDPDRHRPFVEASTGIALSSGATLAAMTAEGSEALWVADLSDGDPVRGEAARDSGLVAATSYPIVGSWQVEGVMEFFLHEATPPDREVSDLIFLIGAYIGSMIDRGRSETALAHSERRAAAELADQQRTLERIARGEPLELILGVICTDVEKRFPGCLCSVLLLDAEERTLRHAAAPTLPREFVREIDGLPVARGLGACGTAAATGETVIIEDILSDQLTEAFTGVATRAHLGSVWSLPLKSSGGSVIGTMALYRRHRHQPDRAEQSVVAASGNLAALAIERHLNERALALAAQVDPLTQLPNRARFLEEVRTRLDAGRDELTVMFLDLDRFKWINDSLGHPAGDRILVEAAKRLRAVVSGRSMVARFGGDEFTVMLTNASPARVLATAERVEQVFAEPFELDGGEFFLTVSIGIASNGDSAYSMVRDADAAMYEAKDRGRARHVWFDDRLRTRAMERLQAESDLRRGIERSEFIVHYQPIADLTSGRWSGVEALARWNHPEGRMVGPADFIPLAEETGLILPLGSRILHSTMAEAGTMGLFDRSLKVAVNLSALQLSDPTLADEVGHLLTSTGVPASGLVLELTESALMEDYENALGALRDIASLGVSVVIDDFGTGYSSISRLNELPVSGIKIDRSFTARIGDDPTVDAIVTAIIDLAHALGLTVVAEGIETASALELLRSFDCDSGQGYHLARPLPAEDALRVLAQPAAAFGASVAGDAVQQEE